VALRLTAGDTAGNRLVYQADPGYVVSSFRAYLPLVMRDYTPSFAFVRNKLRHPTPLGKGGQDGEANWTENTL